MCHDETEVCCGCCSPYEAVVAIQLAGPAKLVAYSMQLISNARLFTSMQRCAAPYWSASSAPLTHAQLRAA